MLMQYTIAVQTEASGTEDIGSKSFQLFKSLNSQLNLAYEFQSASNGLRVAYLTVPQNAMGLK